MRLPARLLLTGAAGFVLASCVSDSALAPAPHVPNATNNAALRSLVVAQSVDLVIPAAGGHLSVLGVYDLDFSAGAVCDPSAQDTQDGYAAGAWDSPCTLANRDVPVRATARYVNGQVYVDFQPALRFAPSARVKLSTTILSDVVQYQNQIGVTDGWAIGYMPAVGASPVADALADPSVQTVIHGRSGVVSRRIKHFSGYIVVFNGQQIPCNPADGDPQCVWVDDGKT